MEENNYRFGVGVLVLAAAIVGVLLMAFFGAVPNFLIDHYRVTINFPSAPGVGPDTPVRKNGVNIGRVVAVKLLEDNAGVNLDLELERSYKIRHGEKCQISIASYITQEAVVEFRKSTDEELLARFDGATGGVGNHMLDPEERELAMTVMSNGDLVQDGVVKGDPFDVLVNVQGDLGKMLTAVERASQKVESLAGTVEDAVTGGRGQVRDVIDRVKGTIDNVNGTLASINRVSVQIENSRIPEAIAEGVERIPELFDEARGVLQQTQRILASFEEFGKSIEGVGGEFVGIGDNAQEVLQNANVALRHIGEFTEPLAENADSLIGDAGQVLRNLDASLTLLREFAQRLNNGKGTVARLIEDDQLYFDVVNAVRNVRALTQRLQPIADDVRIFTDKIARDPGQLGVRGALQGRPIGAGLK
ncbi:MAG: MlaD family protein [Pirellulaceae bacterium]|nr:MlaD family protein [Pirellulaceae bacterium]